MISPIGTPSASARSRSISTFNCGSFTVKELNSPVSTGEGLPAPDHPERRRRQRIDVASRLIEDLELEAAEVSKPGNRRRRERDDDRAADAEERSPTRSRTALSSCAVPFRSAKGFRLEKISPWFGAAPLKLKPMTEKTPSMSGSFKRICSACRAIVPVCSSDEPAGAWTTVMKYPRSSSGTNACGTVR